MVYKFIMTSIANNDTNPRFVYWGLNARGQLPMLLLRAANIEYMWDMDTANTWPAPKKDTPFGQLPILYHNNLVIPQSATIARYCARLANLMPQDEEKRIMADMLIEQANDIFNLFGKAKYAGDEDAQYNAWKELRDVKLHDKLNPLVKLLGDNEYFSGGTHHAGDVAIFSILYLTEQAGLNQELSKYPTLMKHYNRVFQLGSIKDFLKEAHSPYFVAPDVKKLNVSVV